MHYSVTTFFQNITYNTHRVQVIIQGIPQPELCLSSAIKRVVFERQH